MLRTARKHSDAIQPRPVLQTQREETTTDPELEVTMTDLTGTAQEEAGRCVPFLTAFANRL